MKFCSTLKPACKTSVENLQQCKSVYETTILVIGSYHQQLDTEKQLTFLSSKYSISYCSILFCNKWLNQLINSSNFSMPIFICFLYSSGSTTPNSQNRDSEAPSIPLLPTLFITQGLLLCRISTSPTAQQKSPSKSSSISDMITRKLIQQ